MMRIRINAGNWPGIIVLLLFLNPVLVQGQARDFKLSSPDMQTTLHLFLDAQGSLNYEVKWSKRKVIEPSELGLTINGRETGKNVKFVSSKAVSRSEKIFWPIGENSVIDNTFNELDVSCISGELPYNLIVRAYNGSVAFRYAFPGNEKFVISKENTAFNISAPSVIYQYHHESIFTPTSLDTLKTTCDLPATVTAKDFFLSIGEAENISYTKAELQKGSAGNSLAIAFARDSAVRYNSAFSTPWRTISISGTAIGLHQFSELFLKLSKPSPTDLSKIAPGKLIRAQLNTQSGIDCIDLAKKLDFKYIMFDAGWYGPERAKTSDPRVVIPAINMPEVIEYGKKNGIGVILYVNYLGLQNYLDEILPLYKQWGVAGLKFGFIDGFTQEGLTWLSQAISKVNDAGLLLNIHDNYKPTGLSRTYPYLLTQEGIRGDENSPDAFHNTTLPFTRFLAGAADFTFCFPNSRSDFAKNIKVSKAQQLALTVVNFSPLQSIFWYGQPKDYTNFEEIEFFKYVPTVWDESRYLTGSIGKNISVARRKGSTWFIGNAAGLSDWKERVKLDFLDAGRIYKATIYSDGENNEILKTAHSFRQGDKLSIDIKAKGGAAIMLEPQ
ncbi:glycoside hydrolase family 97 protein [Desertivirga arenae]|uniref:glycoside hydrolase family 97 protein n=1 Tax=Desertivirga arenae TaxID=2810309 RepID=UPI001A97389F|nr:glycoside hydrolase family 97 protein [Pedobacter sp. SYSU D00823]